jgi:hypothetical protein
MSKYPTVVNHGWPAGLGQTQKQNLRQKTTQIQWQSWMQ